MANHNLTKEVALEIVRLKETKKLGHREIGKIVGFSASTVNRALRLYANGHYDDASAVVPMPLIFDNATFDRLIKRVFC